MPPGQPSFATEDPRSSRSSLLSGKVTVGAGCLERSVLLHVRGGRAEWELWSPWLGLMHPQTSCCWSCLGQRNLPLLTSCSCPQKCRTLTERKIVLLVIMTENRDLSLCKCRCMKAVGIPREEEGSWLSCEALGNSAGQGSRPRDYPPRDPSRVGGAEPVFSAHGLQPVGLLWVCVPAPGLWHLSASSLMLGLSGSQDGIEKTPFLRYPIVVPFSPQPLSF